jgi:hypothetical protein
MSFARSTFPCQGMLIGGEAAPPWSEKQVGYDVFEEGNEFLRRRKRQLLLAIERNSLHGNSTRMWCTSSVDRFLQAQDLFTKIILQVWSVPSL